MCLKKGVLATFTCTITWQPAPRAAMRVFLTVQRVERVDDILQAKNGNELLGDGNLVGLVVFNFLVGKDDLLLAQESRKHLDGLLIMEPVETPAHGFAVERDEARLRVIRIDQSQSVRPKRLLQCLRIRSVQGVTDRAVGGS